MKKIVRSIVLGLCMAAPMVSGAATITNELNLGVFPSAIGFSDTTDSTAATTHMLPVALNSFIDNWAFSVIGSSGNGTAQVTVNGISVANIGNLAAQILTVGPLGVLFQNPDNILLGSSFGSLAAGNYVLRVTGDILATQASYSGNLSIKAPTATPIPAAVWLFGSALIGLMGVSGRKKTLS